MLGYLNLEQEYGNRPPEAGSGTRFVMVRLSRRVRIASSAFTMAI